MFYSNRESYISIISLYLYDNTIFDNLTVPTGINRDLLINNILEACGNLETFYPNPDYLKASIGWWSDKNSDVFQKMYDTTQFIYDPIANKDALIEDERQINEANSHEGQQARASQGQSLSNTQSEDKIAGFNSSDYVDSNKAIGDGSTESQGAETSTDQSSGTRLMMEKYKHIEKGNIGVTTTQQMIEAERNIDQFNIYDYIVNNFKNAFCVLVY